MHHRYRKPADIVYYSFLAANAIPSVVLLIPFYKIAVQLGKFTLGVLGIDSIWGLMLPYIAGGIPFMTLMMVAGLKGIPLEMEEAAIVDGCGLGRLIFSIDLPLIKPVLVTLFIFSFVGVWNEFNIASIQLNSIVNFTLPLALAFFKEQFSQDYGAIMRGVVIILLPQVVFFFIFQKRIVEGLVTTGLKG
jgi:raffinose/stachyose/melibiose transport system permease protein